jgi:PAS domain S-box-containing protein
MAYTQVKNGFILIVEDDRGAGNLMAGRLAPLGLELRLACSAREALQALKSGRPELMLLDYALPEMTALEFLAELEKEKIKAPPFMCITGYGDEKLAVEAMKAGALDYLVKDSLFLETLPDRVKTALEKAALTTELEAERDKYKALFESFSEAVFVHKLLPDGTRSNFCEVNDIACERLGYTRGELLKLSPVDINPPELAASLEKAAAELRRAGRAIFDMVYLAKSGRRLPVEVSCRIFDYKSEKYIISVVRERGA